MNILISININFPSSTGVVEQNVLLTHVLDTFLHIVTLSDSFLMVSFSELVQTNGLPIPKGLRALFCLVIAKYLVSFSVGLLRACTVANYCYYN